MQLGFVIDHSKCIGCHACTVACKSENDVPLGSFRTWVKYTEQGVFPDVRRSFAVLRCNQCTRAPCVTICPVRALHKRPDGIVDIDTAACIGCKACMQGCPYDALYLNSRSGIAEKCHFCAHRTELGLAPACAVVCPTEAIIPGDLHDPGSAVSKLRASHELLSRKPEAGTGPNVLYRDVSPPGIEPGLTRARGGYMWSQQLPGVERAADATAARTTYDVDHPTHWGFAVSAYLFTKSLAAGLFLILGMFLLPIAQPPASRLLAALSIAALGFLALTALLLVVDLARPSRFLYVLLRPNWASWLARGSFILMAYGALLTVWTLAWVQGWQPGWGAWALWICVAPFAALTAGYTGWLFGQAKGRVLWMRRGLWLHLIIQAWLAGSAFTLLLSPLFGLPDIWSKPLRLSLAAGLVLHAAWVAAEGFLGPVGRGGEYHAAHRLLTRGPYAARRWALAIGAGIAVPLVVLLLASGQATSAVAAASALGGLFIEEDTLVRAGQALPIS